MSPLSVLIPSALKVAPEMEVDFGPIPPVLVPIGGKVALERIIEQYAGFDATFYIAVEEGADLVEEHLAFFPNDHVHLVRVGKTISIAHTLDQVFEKHPEISNGAVVLNFADTMIEDLPKELIGQDFISFAATIESQRWTLVKTDQGRISEISDKKFQIDASEWQMLLGVWGFADGSRLKSLLEQHQARTSKSAFYDSLLDYYNNLNQPPAWEESTKYIDCGHADSYYAAKKRLINARFFNSLEFNESSGTIRKTSENREKLIDEIHWLQALPKELKSYTPAVYDYSRDPLAPFVEMEFYAYPSLDESFVSARFDFDAWEKLFDKLFGLIRKAGKYVVRDDNHEADLREMYVQKTLDRLKMIDMASLSQELAGINLTVDGVKIPHLDAVSASLEPELTKVGAISNTEFQIVHGDLCLGNILYDAKHGLLKLIDARGRFGRYAIYGDVYYDLAKLSHSILGSYDFIVSDRFRVESDGAGNFELKLKTSEYHQTVGRIFKKYLAREGFDLARVQLIESLLFMSMVPLHRDRPKRQLAMLLQGLKLYGEQTSL